MFGIPPRRFEPTPALPFGPESSYRNLVAHLPESVLEEYALGRLTKYRVVRVDEHVQCCGECRKRLESEMEIVVVMRAAGERFRRMGGRSRLQSVQALSGRRKGSETFGLCDARSGSNHEPKYLLTMTAATVRATTIAKKNWL